MQFAWQLHYLRDFFLTFKLKRIFLFLRKETLNLILLFGHNLYRLFIYPVCLLNTQLSQDCCSYWNYMVFKIKLLLCGIYTLLKRHRVDNKQTCVCMCLLCCSEPTMRERNGVRGNTRSFLWLERPLHCIVVWPKSWMRNRSRIEGNRPLSTMI